MASGETSNPMEYKTCVLRVSIHCEGCKKKVRKILKSIEGVFDTQFDSQLHKVSVTGNVDADTLIKKLLKSGKHAELWPESKPTNPNPSSGSDNKDKDKDKDKAASKSDEPVAISDKKIGDPGKDGEKSDKPVEAAKTSEKASLEAADTSSSKPPDPEPKKDVETAGDNSDTGEKAADSSKGSKKGVDGGEVTDKAAVSITSDNSAAGGDGGVSPPKRQHPAQEFPMNPPPQPVHAYSMTHPTMSYSYYAPTPAYPPQGYAYSQALAPPVYRTQDYTYSDARIPAHPHHGHYGYSAAANSPPMSYYSPYSAYPPPESYRIPNEIGSSSSPPRSYDMFSDENANSCKIM